jgi:hypothetical protein
VTVLDTPSGDLSDKSILRSGILECVKQTNDCFMMAEHREIEGRAYAFLEIKK